MLIFCASCVPFYFETYYHPEATTGVVTPGGRCGGPLNRIEFVVNGIKVGHGAYRAGQTLQITMIFHVPEKKTVKLRDASVHIRIPGSPAGFRAQFTEAVLGGEPGPPSQPADQPMIGGTKVFRGMLFPPPPRPVFYVMKTSVEVPDVEVLIIKLPAFEINGIPVELPEVTLTRKEHVGFFQAINC